MEHLKRHANVATDGMIVDCCLFCAIAAELGEQVIRRGSHDVHGGMGRAPGSGLFALI